MTTELAHRVATLSWPIGWPIGWPGQPRPPVRAKFEYYPRDWCYCAGGYPPGGAGLALEVGDAGLALEAVSRLATLPG